MAPNSDRPFRGGWGTRRQRPDAGQAEESDRTPEPEPAVSHPPGTPGDDVDAQVTHVVPAGPPRQNESDETDPLSPMGYRRMEHKHHSRRVGSEEQRSLAAAAQQEYVRMQLQMLIDRLRHLGIDMSGVQFKSGPQEYGSLAAAERARTHAWDVETGYESNNEGDELVGGAGDGKAAGKGEAAEIRKKKKGWSLFNRRKVGKKDEDGADEGQEKRPVRWITTYIFIVVMTLLLGLMAKVAYDITIKTLKDKQWPRFWGVAVLPWTFFVLYFSVHIIVNNLFGILGPIAHCERNSKYYSAIPPGPKLPTDILPPVTIQVPVYKESLANTITPTLESILAACKRYEEEGGKANIVIYDDGLIMLTRPEQTERIRYYRQHGIAYVARPAENRRGRFKKASNLNFGMALTVRVQERMEKGKTHTEALRDLIELDNHSFKAAGNIQMGEYLLLVDSDTRVPEDCLLPLVLEMKRGKKVAFIQNATDPMQQVHDYWENAISHFTWMVYHICISVSCSGGDPAPLVGHNVFLRWSTMQEVAFVDKFDGKVKYWSENAVSEDFDYSMRVQAKGYVGRYANYLGGFSEGVSLSVHDEITRFKKYAFGAAEMIFNPVYTWCYRGIFSQVIWRYLLTRQVPISARLNIIGYLGTYFAMASAPLYVAINYGLYAQSKIYRETVVRPLDVMVTVSLIFMVYAPFTTIIMKHRLAIKWSVWGEYKYQLIFLFFFSGLGYHLLVAIIAHLFGMRMDFSVTVKELKKTNFFKEVRATLVGYWKLYLWCLLGVCIVVGGHLAPEPYKIREFHAWVPLTISIFFHFTAPIVLNPVLMMVKF